MNVKEIIIAHLKEIGADGLCNGGCRCLLMDDIIPCNAMIDECEAGWIGRAPKGANYTDFGMYPSKEQAEHSKEEK